MGEKVDVVARCRTEFADVGDGLQLLARRQPPVGPATQTDRVDGADVLLGIAVAAIHAYAAVGCTRAATVIDAGGVEPGVCPVLVAQAIIVGLDLPLQTRDFVLHAVPWADVVCGSLVDQRSTGRVELRERKT